MRDAVLLKLTTMRRSAIADYAVFIGNVLDHFDTSLYILLAPVMAPVFFPHQDPIIKLILAYSILITSVITKPIGSMIFGFIACSRGPIVALSYSLIGVAITTVLIGCLPDYHAVGYISPCFLIIIRIFREIFSGGESTVAKIYMIENKAASKAIQSSYCYNISSILGIILASIAATIATNNQAFTYAWRLCFFMGASVGLVGVFLRKYSEILDKKLLLASSANFSNLDYLKINFFKSIWQHKNKLLKIIFVIGFSQVTYVVPFVFFNVFVPMVSALSVHSMLKLNNFLLIFDLIMLIIIGKIISNYIKNNYIKKILLLAAVVLSVSIVPLFMLLKDCSLISITLIRLWIIFWGVVFSIPVNMYCQNLLANLPEKYFLMGIGNSLGSGLIGKTSTCCCLYLWYKTNTIIAPAIYIAILMLLTVVVVGFNLASNCIFAINNLKTFIKL